MPFCHLIRALATAHSHRNLPAHQARQQQVAAGTELLVLSLKAEALRDDWRDDILELIPEQTRWHKNRYAV